MMLNNYRVPQKNRIVSLSAPLPAQDISGQTASTTTVDKGQKAQELSVTLTLNFTEAAELNALQTVARAKDDNGDPVIYTVVDPLAKAMNIRQVKFVGTFRVNESQGQQAWAISFTLSEHLSVAEKKEQRQQAAQVQAQQAEGDSVTPPETTPASEQPNAPELTAWESLLQSIDNVLAPED